MGGAGGAWRDGKDGAWASLGGLKPKKAEAASTKRGRDVAQQAVLGPGLCWLSSWVAKQDLQSCETFRTGSVARCNAPRVARARPEGRARIPLSGVSHCHTMFSFGDWTR